MSRSEKDRARRCARDAVPEELRARVNEALMHMDELSYAERLRYLTDLTRDAIPNVAGLSPIDGAIGPDTTSEWEQRIKAVRNGFAHQVPRGAATDDRDEWREQVILLRTLYWVVSTAMLLQTGIKAAQLRTRAEAYLPYKGWGR